MISVVIPSHNRPDGLMNSLESICSQTLLPREVIVIDDGSTPPISNNIFDGFPDAIKTVLLRNPIAKGANDARNRGVLKANGEFIAFLDDDDRFKLNKIEYLTSAIKKNPHIDVFYHPAHIHMPYESVSYISKPNQIKQGPEGVKQLLIGNPIGGTPMVTIRKKAIVKAGMFDQSFPALQDKELYTRLAIANYVFLLVPPPLTDYYHRTNESSITKSINNYLRAQRLFEKKYSQEISLLSDKEKKALEAAKLKAITHRYLLANNLQLAIKHQIKGFIKRPSLKAFLSIFVYFGGKKFTFKLRSLFDL